MIRNVNRLNIIVLLALLSFLLPVQQISGQTKKVIDYDKAIDLANHLALEGKYEVSRLVCNRVLKDKPEYVDAYFIIGNTYAWEGSYENARRFYYRVFEYENGNKEVFKQLIAMELWEGDGNGAIEISNKALSYHPYDPDILLLKARAYIMLGELFNAKKTYYLILADDPNNSTALEAYRSILVGVPVEAQINNKTVLRLTPVDSLFNKAQGFAWNQRFPEAKERIDQILDAHPGYLPAYVLLAQTYAWQNEYEQARVIANSLNLANPGYREGIDIAINIELWEYNYDEAIMRVDSLGLKYYPYDREYLMKKAEIYLAKGNTFKSKEIVYQLLSQDSNDYAAIQFFNELLNKSLRDQRDYPIEVQAIIKEKGIDSEALMEKARELAEQNRFEEVQEICVTILDAFPDSYEAQFLLGNTYAWMNRFDEARERYQKLMLTTFDSKELISSMVDLETWDEKLQVALIKVNYGLQIYPNDRDFLLKKAGIYERLGETENATRIFNQLISSYPDDGDLRKSYYSLKGLVPLNAVSGEFTFTTYDLPAKRSWQMYSARYFKTNDIGTFIGSVNTGFISSDKITPIGQRSGIQFEVSAYPVFKEQKRYFHLSYGFSPSIVFAKHRVGAHIYQEFAPSWEFTAGFNLNQYGDSLSITRILIFQGGITKYWQNYSAGLLINFVPSAQKLARGYTLIGRRIIGRPDNWIQLALSSGAYPENPVFYLNDLSLTPAGLLNSYSANLSVRYMLNTQWIGRVLVGYSTQEYMVAQPLRNAWTINLALVYLLKAFD